MIYAPIAITTLNRVTCLKKCIVSLQKNEWAELTDVYIAVDYPPTEKYKKGYEEVVEYLKKGIGGFKSVNIYFHKENKGPLDNLVWLQELVMTKCDRFIYLEDDNEVAPCFLQFCNKGLEMFEKDESVVAINASDYVWCEHGHTPEEKSISNDENNVAKRQLLFHAFATWNRNMREIYDLCQNRKLYYLGRDIYQMRLLYRKSKYFFYHYIQRVFVSQELLPWKNGKLYPIDSVWNFYMLLNDKYVVYPLQPLVRDWGVDGNGVNYNTAFENAEALKKRTLVDEKTFSYKLFSDMQIDVKEIEFFEKKSAITLKAKISLLKKYFVQLFRDQL